MDIRFACSRCGQHIAIDEAGAGLQIECPGCRSQVIVPELAPAAPVSPIQTRIRRAPSTAGASAGPAAPVAQPQPAVAPPPLPAGPARGDQYRCNNPSCGAILWESQLATMRVGAKSMQVCPKCRLGVTKIRKERSFWAMLPGAFVYPFRGNGAWILALGTPLLLANDFLGFGLFLIVIKLILLGLIGSVLIHIIWSTADDETAKLEWPDFGNRFEMLTVGLQIVGSVLLVFAPVIVCLLMMIRAGNPAWALAAVGCGLFGLAYYPMAFLAFAMFDSLNGVNPLIVVPAIARMPLQYLVVLVLIGGIAVGRGGLGLLCDGLPLGWRLACLLPLEWVAFYSLILSARIMGLLYKANSARLGWFE